MASLEGNLADVLSLRVVQMDGAGQARVKGMDGAYDFDGLFEVGYRRSDERGLEG
jgi:hypothetical protein